MSKCVLDVCSLIAFLNDEKGADIVEFVLNNEISFIHPVNLYEVFYDYKKRNNDSKMHKLFYNKIIELPFKIDYNMNYSLLNEASYFKVNYNISLADSFALALSKVHNASLVTSDHHEFDDIDEKEDIVFKWIR